MKLPLQSTLLKFKGEKRHKRTGSGARSPAALFLMHQVEGWGGDSEKLRNITNTLESAGLRAWLECGCRAGKRRGLNCLKGPVEISQAKKVSIRGLRGEKQLRMC